MNRSILALARSVKIWTTLALAFTTLAQPAAAVLINNYAGNITVTVSSEDSANSMLGSDTVNGSGFGGTAPNFTDADVDGRPEHDATIGNLWRTASGTISNHWISFDLGATYTVTNVVIWNFNQSGNYTKGISNLTLWASTSASPTPVPNPSGPDWTSVGAYTLTKIGSGSSGFDNVDVIALNVSARHILFDVYTIFADVASDRCGLSEVQFFATVSPPSAPTGLTAAKVSYQRIDLSWTDNAGNEDGFKIERKTGAGGTYAQIDTVGANVATYTNTGLSSETEYYYRVRAYNAGGDSDYSNDDNATTDPGPPAAPSALNLTPMSTSRIDLHWTDNASTETGFEIERKTGAGGTYAPIATVGANITAYTNTGLSTDTEYYYRVRATNAIGASAYCTEASASTWPNPPAAPSALVATAVSGSRIDLSWTDNANNETGFRIERKTGAGGTYAQVASAAANANSHADTGLSANTEYYYRLSATNAGGASGTIEDNATTLDDRFYVAKHGLNTNPGTKAAPWQTIQYAVTNVTSGQTILIGEGTYTENVLLTNTIHSLTIKGGHNTNDWTWSPSNHVTVISGAAGARIQLGGDSSHNGLPSVSNTIMGLTLKGGQYGIRSPYHASVMGSVTISHCIITNQGNNGWSISANGGCDFTVINSLVGYSDIGLYSPSATGPVGTNYIFNCTFVTNKRAHVWILAGKTVVRNTIVHGAYGAGGGGNEGYGIAAGATAANAADVSHSLVYGNTVNTNGLVAYGDGMITDQAPLFMNYAGGNYRLSKDSPGHNDGVAISTITDDLDLLPRPKGGIFDIGAYEYPDVSQGSIFAFF